ncbi:MULTISPECIES: hypothetical protein [Bacillus cereus group]|uniref:hypothetical protein n=1 Tax=Bacillus cereus group TaxID=86661 RepID=UPI001879AF0F|nr:MULTISPECIES: hypothetical protein [Bacillus cereus group]MBE7141776.1 hypothetical protein [Bacillus paranthracis]MDF0736478.1 hypothetical protein [Bacillus pacificus]
MLNFKGMSTKEKVLFSLNPTAYLIGKGSVKAVEKVQDLTNSNATVQELRNEAVRQEILSQMAESQARVAQELAIAQRINTAEQVEIEEFYDNSGKAGLTANFTEEAITAGLSGEGRKVKKRIYRFTGWHEGATQVFDQMNENDD